MYYNTRAVQGRDESSSNSDGFSSWGPNSPADNSLSEPKTNPWIDETELLIQMAYKTCALNTRTNRSVPSIAVNRRQGVCLFTDSRDCVPDT